MSGSDEAAYFYAVINLYLYTELELPMELKHINQRLVSYISDRTQDRYDLSRMRRLMELLGNPQNLLRIIHVAGTSGKTSTAYYAASFLKEAGYKVGLTVSPHISKVSERAQINLETLPDDILSATLGEFLDIVDGFELQPTYFEVLIAFAYWFFHKQGVDYAVIEVGLGGLVDGTNVIDRPDKICVITDIGLDHVEILGDTIEEIAVQKAGIIYPENHVWMHSQGGAVEQIVTETCARVGASLYISDDPHGLDHVEKYALLPKFQRRNSTLAYGAVCDAIGHQLSIAQIANALKTSIPGRMEIFHYNNKTIILDGAHNEQKITALVSAINATYAGKQLQLVVSFGENKASSVDRNLELLHTVSDSIILTEFELGQDMPRKAISATELSQHAKAYFDLPVVCSNAEKAFHLALKSESQVILFVGSFYLLNHIRPLLVMGGEAAS